MTGWCCACRRCVDGVTLRVALEQSLRCPLLGAAGPCSLARPPRFAPGAGLAARGRSTVAQSAHGGHGVQVEEADGGEHPRKW